MLMGSTHGSTHGGARCILSTSCQPASLCGGLALHRTAKRPATVLGILVLPLLLLCPLPLSWNWSAPFPPAAAT